ncbi:MAG: hypothetical protein IKB90_05845, partial [Alistipes sp.]|nr:hypothetical protein [Alistipes sp.]
ACVTDTTEDLGIKVEGQGVTELALSLEESRTHLGEKAEGVYPLYWSEGDAIAVNGVVSNPLTAGGEATATFSFAEEVTAPLCVVYPASAAATVEEGEGEATEPTPAPVTAYPVTFLAEQPYTVGTFAPQAAPMYGYAAELPETGIELQHLTGVLRLAIAGNGEKVTSIKAVAQNGKIAGAYTVDCTNGTLTPSAEATNTVTVTFAEPLVLSAEATPVYLTVPAGNYGTFMISVYTEAHEKMTVKFNSDIKPINAGAVREFSEFTYAANTNDAEGVFIIDSKEALIEFARIAGTFYPRTKAVVTAEIDMTGYDWTPIANFGAFEFDGGEFAIKGLNASLFGATEATIKNVKLTDVNIEAACNASYGVIAHSIVNGGLENCSASGNLTYNYTDIFQRVGGLVGYLKNSSFFDCTNDVDIKIVGTVAGEILDISIHFGGLVGWLENPTTKVTNCVNNGTITAEGQIMRINAGGFIGYCDAAANIENCHNHGEMTLTAEIPGKAFSVWTGFIGCSDAGFEVENPEFTISNCSNTADVTFGAKGGDTVVPTAGKCSATLHVGGFHGYTRDIDTDYFSVKFTNCTNSGSVEANSLESDAVKVSGLLSQLETDLTMDKCKNMGNLSIVRGSTYTPNYIAGFTCHVKEDTANEYSNVIITNSSNEGKIYVGKEISNTGVAPQAGIIGYVEGTTVRLAMNEVHNKGEITLCHTTSGSNPYFGGMIGYNKGVLSMENCSNTKAMTIHATINEQARNTYIGGIIGYNGASENKLFKNVNNSGDITVTGACALLQVGGLFGSVGANDITIDSCTNSGDILVENAQKFNYKNGQIGGILGASITSSITANILNSTNSGDITVKNSTFDYTFAVGGICGQAIYNKDNQTFRCNLNIENATNEGDILIENSKTTSSHISVGGIVAANTATDVTTVIKNPIQRGDITITDSSEEGFAAGVQIGGISGYLGKGSITNNSTDRGTISGNISLTTKKMGGISYVAGIVGFNNGLSEISDIKVVSTTAKPSSISSNIGEIGKNSYVAGLVGYNEVVVTYKNLSNAATVSTTINEYTANNLYMGGGFGRLHADGTTVQDCSNSGAVNANITTAAAIAYVGGLAGIIDVAATCSSSHNSGAVTLTEGSSTKNVFLAGLVGNFGAATTMSSCYNSGKVDFNVTTTSGGVYVGGISGYVNAAASSVTSSYNSGALTVTPKTSITGTTNIGGVFGAVSKLVTTKESYNTGAITLKKGKYVVVYLGGFVGDDTSSNTESTIEFENCYNKGAITLEDGMTSTGNIRMGGFIGYIRTQYDKNVANYGDIYVGATTTKQILLGGVYGYSGSAYIMKGGYVNTGNITITGGTGTATGFAVACGGILGTFYNSVENAINTGNITMTGNASKTDSTFGGIVGYSYGNGIIKNCQSYCTIKAFEKVGNEYVPYQQVGIITGSSRRAEIHTGSNNTANARTAVVRDCEVGGNMVFAENKETVEDPGGESIETITDVLTPLDETSWFNYIYGGTTNWSGVTGYDGCERLAAAPIVDRLDD